ncbi:MAG: hypothetical protein WDN03_08840 [Rhizomicrobium sp.]
MAKANADGADENFSANYGVEGPAGDPALLALRRRQKRNILATLLLSQGVPMILAGDEFGRTQGGNNNAYCQDNGIGWIDWTNADREFEDFVRSLLRLRAGHPAFRRTEFFRGGPVDGGFKDVEWLSPGGEMSDAGWNAPDGHCLGVRYAAMGPDAVSFLLLMNAGPSPVRFTLPAAVPGSAWRCIVATATAPADPAGAAFVLESRALALFGSGRLTGPHQPTSLRI